MCGAVPVLHSRELWARHDAIGRGEVCRHMLRHFACSRPFGASLQCHNKADAAEGPTLSPNTVWKTRPFP